MPKTTRIAFLALAALALPVASAAQDAPQPAAPAQDEAAQIQQRLGALQQQALQDSAVQAATETFEHELLAAMQRIDATVPEKTARAEALKQEVEAARAASDNARLNELAQEAQSLQAFFAQVRQQALGTPEIQEKRQAYLTVIFARMNEIDPEAQALVARLQELRSQQ